MGTYLAYLLSYPAMADANLIRATFIDRILVSSFPGQVAKRFSFADGEVAALYTLGRRVVPDVDQPVILVIATFPPALANAGMRDFGIDYCEQPVASPEEARELLAQFDEAQAVLFRAKCRSARA